MSDQPSLIPQFAIVCIKQTYLGHHQYRDAGEIFDWVITREEADATCAALNVGYGEGCYVVKPFEEASAEHAGYIKNHVLPRIQAKRNEYSLLRNAVAAAKDFFEYRAAVNNGEASNMRICADKEVGALEAMAALDAFLAEEKKS